MTYWGKNALYRNDGHGKFADIAAASGVEGDGKTWSSGCTFLDYDRDGHLDLLVTSYQAFDLATTPPPGKGSNCEWKGMPVFCGPRGLPFGKVTLYHNRGDGTFEDVSVKSGVRTVEASMPSPRSRRTLTAMAGPTSTSPAIPPPASVLRNNKDGTFTDIATEAGVAFNEHGFEQGGMGIAVGDFD